MSYSKPTPFILIATSTLFAKRLLTICYLLASEYSPLLLFWPQNLFTLFLFMEFSAVYLFSFLVNPSSKRILAPKTAEVSGALTSEAFSADSNEPASKRPRVLTVAENVLCWEHLKPHLQEFSRLHPDDNMYLFLYYPDVGMRPVTMVAPTWRRALRTTSLLMFLKRMFPRRMFWLSLDLELLWM